jgi:lysophospholipase L1-like esterase
MYVTTATNLAEPCGACLQRAPLSLRKKLIFAVVPVVVLFTLLEVSCRISCGWDQSWVDCHRFHPTLGWCNREGWTGTWSWTGGRSHINPQGIRHDEPVGLKRPGEKRLLIIGDSVTFGGEVTTAEAYPARLQQVLAAMKPGWRILNGGVTGYDPAQEADWLEFFGCALEPDALAIGFCRNDTCPSARLNGLWRVDSDWAIGNWVLEHSIIAYKLHRSYWRFRAHMAKTRGETLPGQKPDAGQVMGWPFIEQSYRKIAKTAKAHGWPVVVFVFPTLTLLTGETPDELTERLQKLGQELGWTVIDLTPAFQSQPASLFLTDDPIHPTAEGYRRSAEVIAKGLLESDLLR